MYNNKITYNLKYHYKFKKKRVYIKVIKSKKMLEESLQSNTIPPSEIAKSFFIFLKQDYQFGDSTSNNSSTTLVDKRFTNVVTLLCKRLFTSSIKSSSSSSINNKEEEGYDAWLSSFYHWGINYNNNTNDYNKNTNNVFSLLFGIIANIFWYCTENQIEKDKLVKLLSLDLTNNNVTLMNVFLYQGMRYDYNKRFECMLNTLPQPTQNVIMEGILFDKEKCNNGNNNMIVERVNTCPRINAIRLIDLLGNITPPNSNRKEASPNRSPYRATTTTSNIMNSPMRSSPRTKISPSSTSSSKTSPSSSEPKMIMLNMLEYYLISFISFPLLNQQKNYKHDNSIYSILLNSIQQNQPNYIYGNAVYMHLFKMYLSYFLSTINMNNKLSPFVASTTTVNNDIVSKSSELFLRIVIEYWLDGENTLYITSEAIQRLHHHHDNDNTSTNDSIILPLNTAFDLVQSTSPQLDYTPNPPLVSQGIQVITKYLLLDYVSSSLQGIHNNNNNTNNIIMTLTPSMKIIQPSMFNHLRMLIKYAPMVQYGNHCPFLDIVDIWLLYLEPWNTNDQQHHYYWMLLKNNIQRYYATSNNTNTITNKDGLSINIPSPNAPSHYTSHWKNYIASNYHFYTHLLSIFIRRARELDFSKVSSFIVLQRVIRVFSPHVLSELYALSSNDNSSTPPQPPVVNGMMSTINQAYILKQEHNKRLGEYCPPNPQSTLFASCVSDIQNLLQNAVRQYNVLRQTPHAKVVHYFTYTSQRSSIPTEESMYQLANGYKSLLFNQVPLDLQQIFYIPSTTDTSTQRRTTAYNARSIYETITSKFYNSSPTNNNQPEKNGIYLTQKGREQIFNGTKQCKPYQSAYIGDPMKARIQNHEIPFLVHITLRVSCFLNDVLLGIKDTTTMGVQEQRTSLDELLKEQEMYQKYSFRVNLRFLADWRNVLFILFVVILFHGWKLILF